MSEFVPVSVSASAAPRVTVPSPTGAAPALSFVIVTYGTGRLVVDAAASIVAVAGSRPIEVIVVDNAHPTAGDRTFAELALWTRGVRIARPGKNLGFGGGCNLGARLATGQLLVLLNPDAELVGDIQPLVDLLEDESITIAAPTLLDDDGSVQECGQVLFSDATTWPRRGRPADGQPFDVDYASGACWVLRRAEFLRLGGFDEAYHPAYFEDVDFVLRARAEGGRCVVHPGVSVIHHQGQGTPDFPAPAFAQQRILRDRWRDTLATYSAPTAG